MYLSCIVAIMTAKNAITVQDCSSPQTAKSAVRHTLDRGNPETPAIPRHDDAGAVLWGFLGYDPKRRTAAMWMKRLCRLPDVMGGWH